ncbi:MAG: hypothetical protein CL833_07860 [Crocinitomicaceae bacterium]|nr:hypothetical protein [Crocinitomicaceae bacterium]
MSLSTQVKIPVDAANNAMREALAFAARSENAVLISAITDIIAKIESLNFMDALLEDLDQQLKMVKKCEFKKES